MRGATRRPLYRPASTKFPRPASFSDSIHLLSTHHTPYFTAFPSYVCSNMSLRVTEGDDHCGPHHCFTAGKKHCITASLLHRGFETLHHCVTASLWVRFTAAWMCRSRTPAARTLAGWPVGGSANQQSGPAALFTTAASGTLCSAQRQLIEQAGAPDLTVVSKRLE